MISYEENTNKFNFRVGGIIESPDKKKILIHRLSNFDFWLLPGGRVEMLENTKKAILRDAITESFFDIKSSTYHELAFNYLLQLPENSELLREEGEFAGIEGEKYRYMWIDKEDLSNISFKPDYIIPILQNIPNKTTHIIRDERK